MIKTKTHKETKDKARRLGEKLKRISDSTDPENFELLQIIDKPVCEKWEEEELDQLHEGLQKYGRKPA